jgi:hypothetical protein
LIYKLYCHEYPRYLQHLIYSYLKGRSFQVFMNKTFSSQIDTPAGLPQGSVFNSDIPAYLDTGGMSAMVSYWHTARAHRFLDRRVWWLEDQDKFFKNGSKRRRASRFLPDTRINVNGLSVPWASKVKYIGLILDKKLLLKNHIEHILHRWSNLIKIHYPFINRPYRYTDFIQECLQSCHARCVPRAASHKRRLQVIQNQANELVRNCFHTHYLVSTSNVRKHCVMYKSAHIYEHMSTKAIHFNGRILKGIS